MPQGVAAVGKEPPFKISLAEWSIHRTLTAPKATMTNLDFPAFAKRECGIDAVEYVNQFWMDKARDEAYLAELVGSSRVDLQACKLEYSIVSPK